jgi:succinate dehydrogenase/fumarate reductase flavoprotein subunit
VITLSKLNWPYKYELGLTENSACDVLVLGGGLAGCFAAIAAAEKGKSVILVEKGATVRSGAAGTGFDHWEMACTNPGCLVSPEEMTNAFIKEQDHYSNAIAHFIETTEGYDRLLDIERYGGKIRDTDGEFSGAQFRDDKTGFMYAYDYKNRYTMRVWGSTFKPALLKELKRLGVKIFDHTEATALLTVEEEGQKRGTGAVCMDIHTAKTYVFSSRTTVLAMSRPARIWLFNSDTPGLCEFRPFQSIGSGHAMGYRAGMEFTMMEKSIRAEFSAAGRSYPPYGTGNNHNTWYAATMVDSRGKEIPYVDRDGNILKTVSQRYYPASGQKFFLKGGVIDEPKYEFRGPETLSFDELMKRGYKLPFYADLSKMPDEERRVIWGMMVGEEGKTKVPILKNYTERGFDPQKHILQSYGTGWQSASFLDQERQLFGAPGGILNDWDLKTNIEGIYAGGDQLFASDCAGFACATGYYAGRKAADASNNLDISVPDRDFVDCEKDRLFSQLNNSSGEDWRGLNMAVSKTMQSYCGGIKNDDLLKQGLLLIGDYEKEWLPRISCDNPHELMRVHELSDIITVCEMILQSCLLRRSNSAPLSFYRSDSDPNAKEDFFITVYQEHGQIRSRKIPLDYYGHIAGEYIDHNSEYISKKRRNS